MPVIPCIERTAAAPAALDAVWVPNGPGNQLFYPFVSSCVSITLVFQHGLIGGHASQISPLGVASPAVNLQNVIGRMIAADPGAAVRGNFLKIYFIGTTSDPNWNLAAATTTITAHFGVPAPAAAPSEHSLSPVDVVFDTHNGEYYIADRAGHGATTAAQTITDATAIMANLAY
jgi:hypothetical protein